VDLGQIDLLVQEGFYSNRSDLVRTAIRNQLARHSDVVKQTITRRSLTIGLQQFAKADLERLQAAGERIRILGLTVEAACELFAEEPAVLKPLALLRDTGLGYLRLGQPATELSGGEAQRIKLATELQKQQRGRSLYVLDEPTTGLHPADVDKLMAQLQGLVDAGNTVIVVEHDERVIAASDWEIEIGPGAGQAGGQVVRSAAREPVDARASA
jgi:excinuclease UvrABC ATPase subunit